MLVFIMLFACTFLIAQVNHWESIVREDDSWHYFPGFSAPPSDWKSTGFSEASWNQGPGGFGYGDGDDNTVIPPVTSLYIRRTFYIADISSIVSAVLDIDYDDGFVAYLNGTEIARANMEGTAPAYSATAEAQHEALLYQGGVPDRFMIPNNLLFDHLYPGQNVLAIQVHNINLSSSDLTIRPFFSVGINDGSFTYYSTPDWFTAPVDLASSELPIVVIETNGQQIVDDPDVLCEFGIIYNGPGAVNYLSDPKNEYDGYAKIELRGESSLFFEKKSYSVETSDASGADVDASFLNFPEEEDWVLYGPYSDKSLLRNVLIMKIGREMGRYNSRTRMCEVFLNGNYEGVYVLMEKIKRDENRVDIAKLKATDIEGEELTGGYLFRIDKGDLPGWSSNFGVVSAPWMPIRFQYRYPDPDSIQQEQEVYIQSYVDSFERAIAHTPTFINNYGYHYTHYIDLESFVDNFIVNEMTRNLDGYRLSTYFYKDKNSKIIAGPLWDFNISLGNGDYCNGDSYTGWMYEEYCGNGNPFWWKNMLTDSLFLKTLTCRWSELRETTLDEDNLLEFIDSMSLVLQQPAQRNFTRWPILGTYVWPNAWPYPETYVGEIDRLKWWLINRLIWMDNTINAIEADCESLIPTYTFSPSEAPFPLLIYPNPNQGRFILELNPGFQENGNTSLLVKDLTGRVVFEQSWMLPLPQSLILDMPDALSSGLYIIQVIQQQKVVQQGRMVVLP